MVKQRGKSWFIYFAPWGKKIGVKVSTQSKREARQVEQILLRACRTNNYSGLDPLSRETCMRIFKNQRWELSAELGGQVQTQPTEELTLYRAAKLFLTYPGIRDYKGRHRHELALSHLMKKLGKDIPIKSIWVPRLKEYQIDRRADGAAPVTVNMEISTLSRLFSIMIELKLVSENPCRLLEQLSTKANERQVYLSSELVTAISKAMNARFEPIIWTAFYTGMRKGEILGLSRRHVSLSRRMISLGAEDTKEGQRKRVPIHHRLVPILEGQLSGPIAIDGRVFQVPLDVGLHHAWRRTCGKVGLEKPWPWFRDLRHTWKTNARRSGMHPEIEMAIMGHAERGRSVHERYGRISDQELLDAIDRMTFDHGETEIVVAAER